MTAAAATKCGISLLFFTFTFLHQCLSFKCEQAEAVQRELDRLGSTLRQIEAYNDSMKSEIAVTRRAAYTAEEAMQKLEKEKQHQDYIIDDMQVGVAAEQTCVQTCRAVTCCTDDIVCQTLRATGARGPALHITCRTRMHVSSTDHACLPARACSAWR